MTSIEKELKKQISELEEKLSEAIAISQTGMYLNTGYGNHTIHQSDWYVSQHGLWESHYSSIRLLCISTYICT